MELPLLIALTLPGPDANWDVLTKSPVLVECADSGGETFCRSTTTLSADSKALRDTLANMSEHSGKFESIVELHALNDDVMHVVMDFPWPLADRDYVAKYTQDLHDDGGALISWTAVTHAEAPESEERVRLTKFAGSWSLKPLEAGKTLVVYTWHGEYGGALPDAALTTARKKTGHEALKDLANAAGGVDYKSK